MRTLHKRLVALGAASTLLIVGVALLTALIAWPDTSSKSVAGQSPPHQTKSYIFPHGGRTLFPDYRLIALYGTPNDPNLGALGEQSAAASITRVKELAAQYQPLMREHTLPSLEMIATVASSTPTENGDYSREVDAAVLQEWITAARQNGVYVVLDLQPGRSDFLSQAKSYQALLEQPNVGLALDPEWRLGADQVPLAQIGTVGIDEVNQTSQWLSDLTTQHKLPQKLFVLHQFRLNMIQNRDQLDTTHPNLDYVIQMDGSGTQPVKRETWQTVTDAPPASVQFGWKNFYKVDAPTLDPASTMALNPKPAYVSYQ